MNSTEKRALGGIATVLLFRMLGLFMVLPVLAIYGPQMTGATPLLVGVALGAYGLTQGILQIPLGMLSDRIGRHKVVIGGLIFFAFGSVIAALADNIHFLIIGRLFQGGGAIAAAMMALVADVTRAQYRDIAMALIGASMGVAMMLAMVIGVTVAAKIGLSGIFWLTALLAIVGLVIFIIVVPRNIPQNSARSIGGFAALRVLLAMRWVVMLAVGVAIIHFAIMAFFLLLPPKLVALGWPPAEMWKLYVPALLLSIIGMAPLMILSRRKDQRSTLIVATIILMCAFMLLLFPPFYGALYLALWLFFVGFNTLEATMPSLLSIIVPSGNRGGAMGIYATSQFFGAFIGGALCGGLEGAFGSVSVIWITIILAGLWGLWLARHRLTQLDGSMVGA